jgi:hypothetical protein
MLENFTEFRGHVEGAALIVLRLASLQTEGPSVEVDMVPLAREEFRIHTPSSDVGDVDDGTSVNRQFSKNGLECVALEKPLATVLLLEHHERRNVVNLVDACAKTECTPQC